MRFERADLASLLAGARRVIVAKGKSAVAFDVAPGRALPAEALAALLGPTGKLRAPAVRAGTSWLVGFHADAWDGELGAS
ncbi:MAG: hypothetical protein JNK02_02690 [Planctomycetes bacterium]|nr:hypothetical protein [Planctomycetota bacterium]